VKYWISGIPEYMAIARKVGQALSSLFVSAEKLFRRQKIKVLRERILHRFFWKGLNS